MNDFIEEILVSEEEIDSICDKIAADISRDYANSSKKLLLLCILKGSVVFMGELMKKLTRDDRAKTRVLPVSKLGLMEMTRQREHESIQDAVYVNCPYCRGSGLVKSPESMSVEIQRRLAGILRDKHYRKVPVRVSMHPEVLQRLKNQDAGLLDELAAEFKHELSFRADEELHMEEFHFFNADTGVEIW